VLPRGVPAAPRARARALVRRGTVYFTVSPLLTPAPSASAPYAPL